jgi:hypothetical protein
MTRKATRQVGRSGFALRFHEALLDGQYTTEGFARSIDRPLRTVQRWRAGESTPNAGDFALICRATGRGHEYFYPGPEPEEVAA